jgi:hypothetical protein
MAEIGCRTHKPNRHYATMGYQPQQRMRGAIG